MQDMVILLGAETPSGQSIANKLRAEHYFCKLMRSGTDMEQIRSADARGLLLIGEEAEGVSIPDPRLLELGIPVLAIGFPARSLLSRLGTRMDRASAINTVMPVYYKGAALFRSLESGERWISEAEPFAVSAPYEVIADSDGFPIAYGNLPAHVYLLQYQIERNDPDGTALLRTFADEICGCSAWWTTENMQHAIENHIRDSADGQDVLCAMSGGVDSTVAALLTRNAIGDHAQCIFIDTGLLRKEEANETEHYLTTSIGLPFRRIDASDRIIHALKDIPDMNTKRWVVAKQINEILRAEAANTSGTPLLVKGTNYVDTLEPLPQTKRENTWTTILEPLTDLFKVEIRSLGEQLGLPAAMLNRQPFPGMGLAARIRGEVDAARLQMLRTADSIFTEQIHAAGLDKRISRYFAILEETRGETVVILRAVQGHESSMTAARLPYDLLERCVERISKELPSVDRVLYDITPGTPEWLA